MITQDDKQLTPAVQTHLLLSLRVFAQHLEEEVGDLWL